MATQKNVLINSFCFDSVESFATYSNVSFQTENVAAPELFTCHFAFADGIIINTEVEIHGAFSLVHK